jgi:DNA-nicking Smr family endonuclease
MPSRSDGKGRGHREGKGTDRDPDANLWQRAVSDVRPLKRPPPPPPRPASATPPAPKPPPRPAPRPSPPPLPPAAKPRPAVPAAPELEPGAAGGLDKRTLQRLKRGLIPPEATIDLHNKTQAEAHAALLRFLAQSQTQGRRCVLVITGKGYGPDGSVGVLKSGVPRWLNEPDTRHRILAFTHATTAQGGEGALYVLLRRPRDPSKRI